MTATASIGETGSGSRDSVWARLARELQPDEDHPRLAPDIESQSYVTRQGAPYVVIRNPATDTYLRLDPREYELLSLMDGSRTVKGLTIAYFQRYRVLALPRVAGLVALLRQHAFLVDPPVHAYVSLARRLSTQSLSGRLRRAASHLALARWTWTQADPWFGAVYGVAGKYLFKWYVCLFGIALGVLSPLFLAFELQQGRYNLLRVGGTYWAAIAILGCFQIIALSVHELGHGLAVKHAGRRVLGAGLMLYAGAPTAFVDTTDVWMAAPKQRLLVSFAGPWTGMVLGGLALIAAALLPMDTLGSLLFGWGAVFLIYNLLNFNPLLELDGYYLLIDLIDKPLLRARASYFIRRGLWRHVVRREPLKGEEIGLLVYSLLALAWTVLELSLLVVLWTAQVWPTIIAAGATDSVVGRIGLTILVAALAGPLLLAVTPVVRRLPDWLGREASRGVSRASALQHREALEALRAVPAWSELPEARLLEIARALRREDVDVGNEVVRQGERGQVFYVVDRGAFEVLVNDKAVARLGRGDYFGERALLQSGVRQATVVALEPSCLWSLEKDAFDRLLASDLAVRQKLEAAMEQRAALGNMPLFADLSPVEMDLLLMRFESISVEAGAEVVRQGEPGAAFYVVEAGALHVTRDGQALAELGPGDAFGEIALLESVPRTATVAALQPSNLLVLDRAGFHDVLAGYCQRESNLRQLSYLRLASHGGAGAHTHRVSNTV